LKNGRKKKEKPKHLGRGLESLLGPITSMDLQTNQVTLEVANPSNFLVDKKLAVSYQEIPIDKVSANPYQARTIWNEQELTELAESIKANGIVQPILFVPFQMVIR